ncbi:MBL fold metallo-hydrolase [Burkholderia multivorans]|uniref:MBL fold metallo-hydrolase n=1 Tax=Burkholderia multivorans TaxID=87883 RepID=UPI000CFF0157|nr:MBL fold metallo-hydrolase [Burkholderia multivorans]PRE59272.1 MBL fold metallo-hydrolase [Burkholderia multivorans]
MPLLHTIRSRIGDAEVVQIVEMDISGILGALLPEATPDVMKSIPWMTPPYVDEAHRMRAVSQCFIVRIGKRILVIDTCVGNDKDIAGFDAFADLRLEFLATLEQAGIDRHAVTDVLCTHLHFDHVGWNTYKQDGRWLPTFPNAKYHFGKTEYAFAQQGDPNDAMYDAQNISFHESVQPVVDAGLANFIDRDTDLGDGISVFATPGHTIGHIAVAIDAGTEQFIIAGDAMHHPVQIARPEMALVLDYDPAQAATTRHTLLSRLDGSATLFTCTHFCSPSFGRVSRDADGNYVFTGVSK